MEFAEVLDHPDIPGEYLTPEEFAQYNAEKEEEVAAAQKVQRERSEVSNSYEESDAVEREAQLVAALDPHVAHPASGARNSLPGSSSVGITESNPWREDVEDRGLGVDEVHPGAYKIVSKDGKRATRLKERGNARYKSQDFFEAIRFYGQALAYCPTDTLHAHDRAVNFSNRAACNMALGKHRLVVEDCTEAIELDPRYVRALMRRSKAYESMDRLEDAVEDLNAAVEIDGSYVPALQEKRRVQKLYEEKTEKMKDEMLGKLKGFGNRILGKFGMSLDNFKLTPQEGGGYSVAYENS